MSKWICIDELEYDTEWDGYADGFTAYSQIAIDTAPSLDLVRCGECKHWRNIVPTRCTKHFGILVNADDFCSYGERKESQ